MTDAGDDESDRKDQDRSWSKRQRAGWWVKYAAVVGPTVALLTLLSTCGWARLIGLQTVEDAEEQHRQMVLELDTKMVNSMLRVEASLGRLETRIDSMVSNNAGVTPARRPRR